MLQPAFIHQEKLQKLLYSIADDPKYIYAFPSYFSLPKFEETEWNTLQRVCISSDILGYFSAEISRAGRSVDCVKIISWARTFNDKRIFAKDLLKFVLRLHEYRKISWLVAKNNPAIRGYRRFIKHVGGREIGYCEKEWLIHGNTEDAVLFELICTEDSKKKISQLIERLNSHA